MPALPFDPVLLLVCAALAYLGWCVLRILPARVRFADGQIIKWRLFKTEKMAITDLAEIRFHYHAVVGFICVWEFVARSGASLHLEGHGISQRLLAQLECHVLGFTAAQFDALFKEGDVEDTIVVWRAA